MTRVGKIGTTDVRLAGWLEAGESYARRYLPVDPVDERVAGERFALSPEQQVKIWEQSSWRGGEGERVWTAESGKYWRSRNCRPGPEGSIVLGPWREVAEDTAGDDIAETSGTTQATFVVNGSLDGGGALNLLCIDKALNWESEFPRGLAGKPPGAFREWADFDMAAAGGSDNGTGWPAGRGSAAPGFDDGVLLVGTTVPAADIVLGHVKPPQGFEDVGASDVVTVLFDDVHDSDLLAGLGHGRIILGLYHFVGSGEDDWDISVGLAVDVIPDSARAITAVDDLDYVGPPQSNPLIRPVITDVGAAYLYRTGSETFIREYNVGADSAATIGQIPGRALPSDMLYAHGFVFVLFEDGPAGFDFEDATEWKFGPFYLYYQRGGLRGTAGPLRLQSGETTGTPGAQIAGDPQNNRPVFFGVRGSELFFWFDEAVWSYNLAEGAFCHVADAAVTIDADWRWRDSHLALDSLFLYDDDGAIQRWSLRHYTTEDAWLEHGSIDFQYPGMDKILLDVTVDTDPLPAGTQVTVAVAADEGTFTTLSGTHSTDGETTHTFVASTNSATISGKTFRIRVMPDTTDFDETPTVRRVSARATGAAHRLEWVLQIDAGDVGSQDSASLIDALNTLAASGTVVQFSDPWQNPDHESADTFDVTVEEVITPESKDDESGQPTATVRLRAVSLQ